MYFLKKSSNSSSFFYKALLLFCHLLVFHNTLLYSDWIEKKNYQVTSIKIELPHAKEKDHILEKTLLDRLHTRQGERFSQEDLDKDLKFLAKEYDRVDPQVDYTKDGVTILLRLWVKPKIVEMIFEGNDKLSQKDLENNLDVKKQQIFDRPQFNRAFQKLKTYLVKQGFYDAKISYIVEPLDGRDEVRLRIQVHEGPCGKIAKIKMRGLNREEKSDLWDMIATKEYFLFTSWATGAGTYDQQVAEQDVLRILSYLHDKGYADAQVTFDIVDAPKKQNRIHLIINVDKGDVYTFGKITFTGNTLFSNELVASLFKIRNQGPFSPRALHDTADAIKDYYGSKGYIDARVSYDPKLNQETKSFDVDFKIHEGEKFRVGLIKVFGNIRTKTSVIIHETLLVPGQIFNIHRLKKTETNLQNIGYFEKVNVYLVKGKASGLGKSFRDVHIEVEEKGTGKFGVYGAVSSQGGLTGGIHITESNFDHNGYRRFLSEGFGSFRGGGEYLYGKFSGGTREKDLTLSWAKPHFMDTPWTLRLEGAYAYNRIHSKSHETHSKRFSAYAIYNLNPFMRAQIYYRLNDNRSTISYQESSLVSSADIDTFRRVAEFEANQQPNPINRADLEAQVRTNLQNQGMTNDQIDGEIDRHTQALFKQEAFNRAAKPVLDLIKEDAKRSDGVISAVGVSLSYDTTNHPMRPSEGFYSELKSEYAGLGGSHRFWKFAYLNTLYTSLSQKLIAKCRWDLNFLLPQGKEDDAFVPTGERFYLGGDQTVRGYRPFCLGPQYQASTPGGLYHLNSRAPMGGYSSLLLSMQLDYELNRVATPFIFLDGGHLSDKKWHITHPKYFKWSYGTGVQVTVMPAMPPLVFGFAKAINPDRRDDKSNFFFTIGLNF